MVKTADNALEVHNMSSLTSDALSDLDAQFLEDLEQRLRPIGLKEREILLELKKKEHQERSLPFDGEFYASDKGYYAHKYVEQSLDIDSDLLREQ